MATQTTHEVILYDLACTKNVCFSPVAWRIRLMLNYKRVSYKTIFLEFPDIEPTLKGLGITLSEAASQNAIKYTIPAIHHIPSNTIMNESVPIAQFIEATYPHPAVQLSSDLGHKLEIEARATLGKLYQASLLPREPAVLSPRAAVYFRRTRQAGLGYPIEDLLNGEQEETKWTAAESDLKAVSDLLLSNQAEGPFVLGAQPSYTDFFFFGNLRCARVVDEDVFQRFMKYPGFKAVYEACLPYTRKED